MSKWLAGLFLVGALHLSWANAQGGVEELIAKLFEILEVKHQEILSTEENITHNRSESEKNALISILQQKVRAFVRKDAQMEGVLKEIQSSKDPEKIFLYQKSMDQLNQYRKGINQIQELYFRKPLSSDEPVLDIPTADGNFEAFLGSWENKAPLAGSEERKMRASVPVGDQKYFDAVKRTYLTPDSIPEPFPAMVKDMTNVQDAPLKEIVPLRERKPLDSYHHQLAKEAPVIKMGAKDTPFKNFFTDLEDQMNRPAEAGQKAMHKMAGARPAPNLRRGFEEELQPENVEEPPLPSERVQALLKDMDQYRKEKKEKPVLNAKTSFETFMGEIEEAQPKALPAAPPQEPKKMSKAKAEPAKTSQEFSTFMQTMAQEGGLRGPNDTISFTDPKSTNRYEIILNDLMHLNRVSPQEMVVAESPKEALAQELGTIFPEEKTGARPKPKPLQNAKTMTPRFDNFAGNGHVIQAVQEREIGFVEALPEKPAPMSDMESAPKPVEPKPMASTQLSDLAKPVAPIKSESPVQENTMMATDPGDIDKPLIVAAPARKAEARMLRNGSSLIPIRLETRDIKDRLYSELPITFEVEMKPHNFIAGHILDSTEKSPWKKIVNTNSEGVAQIQLLLDLQNHEINISREVKTTTESTVCKILITPKF